MFRLFPVTVTFPMTPLSDKDVEVLTVLRQEDAMDVAKAVLSIDHNDIRKYVGAGSPLRIRWGNIGRFDEFVGYVHSYRPIVEGATRHTEIVAISAAYPMVNESGTTYYQVGLHNVVQQIGDNYRFQVETDPHPYVHDQILQKGDSDWTLMRRLARQWGYALMVDGVTLICRPLKDLLEENYRFSTLAQTHSTASADPRANILAFEESYSATGKQPMTTTVFQGVNPVDVATISQTERDPLAVFDEIDTSKAITSDLEGELKIDAVLADSSFPFSAKATVRAPWRTKPYDAWRISNDGETKTWVVRSVKHIVTGNDYQGEIEFGSDGVDHSARTRESHLDIVTLLKKNRRTKRPDPVIIDSRPYFVGAGASAVVPDQRWKARVMTVPVEEKIS